MCKVPVMHYLQRKQFKSPSGVRCEVNVIKGSRCNAIMRLQRIVLYAGVGVCDDGKCNQRLHGGVMSQRQGSNGTDDSGQKAPLVAMGCLDHFIVHVLHTLRIQFQGRVETYSIQLGTRLVYLVQVFKVYYYVGKLTLQAWHYIIAWRSKLWRSRFYAQNKSGNIQVQYVTLLLKTYSFRGELNRILSGMYQCSRCRAAWIPSL